MPLTTIVVTHSSYHSLYNINAVIEIINSLEKKQGQDSESK